MTGKRSLKQVLARQWVAFALLLFAGFAAMSLLMLWMLEDTFIDSRLRAQGDEVRELAAPPALPPDFALYVRFRAPEAWLAATKDQRPGVIREFRLPDGRYLHVLAGQDLRGRAFLLGYDVSDQLNVNAALARAWPWLLGMALFLAALARALAVNFVARVSLRTRELVNQVGWAEGPGSLRTLAADEPILEFSELARLSADALEARVAAMNRERETLAFLGHELRTPLQSARTSLALLQDDRGNEAAWGRLQRAQNRLARASHSILWLAGDAAPEDGTACNPGGLLDGLIVEFTSLAAGRRQSLWREVGGAGISWPLPPDVAETVIANLLLNAIQHGGPGEIGIDLQGERLVLRNPVAGESSAGFGLGLRVVQRLLARFGWSAVRSESDGHVSVTVGPGQAAATR